MWKLTAINFEETKPIIIKWLKIRTLSIFLKGRDSLFIKGKKKNNWTSDMYKRNMVGKPAEYIKTEIYRKNDDTFLNDRKMILWKDNCNKR